MRFLLGRYAPILLLSVLLFSNACKRSPKSRPVTPEEVREPLMEFNKQIVKSDDEKIRRFIERYNLEMSETGTGLRYNISGEGKGEVAKNGQYAMVDYKVSLLDGTVCYVSDGQPEEFLIGMDNVESGLHEAITYMKVGQKGKFIMPPHLAHGLIGDEKKIPSRATIIYDIELLNLR
jgi:FKBP-type peptidyl-prolyl cis-trans isomerase FkpA